MSATPGLGAFNKDKVANKFGIQLRNKDTNKQSQQPLISSPDKNILNTQTSIITKNKTVSDFRGQNQSNGFQSITNSFKTSEPIKRTLENSSKSKSNIELLSTSTYNERRDSFNSNDNHSKSLNPVKTNQSIKSNSQSSSNILLSTKSSDTVKRSSLTPMDRTKSPEPSSIKQTIITKTTERAVSPIPSPKQTTIPTTITKTEAQIEHQKDQPLYKRQLSKTLDNTISIANKSKHHHELPTLLNTR